MECRYYIGKIEGISKTNTPYFASFGDQVAFFNEHLEQISVSGFYPPFYRNEIKCNTEDVNFLSDYNYFRITVQEGNRTMRYYYFITGVNYISPNVVSFSIEMDTIQTFYFYTKLNNAVVERGMIRRFVNNKVNRDYIRENFSTNEFKVTRRTQITAVEYSRLWCVGIFAGDGDYEGYRQFNEFVYQVPSQGDSVPTPSFTTFNFMVAPADAAPYNELTADNEMGMKGDYLKHYTVQVNNNGVAGPKYEGQLASPQSWAFKTWMNAVHFFPFNPFADIAISGNTITVDTNNGFTATPVTATGGGSRGCVLWAGDQATVSVDLQAPTGKFTKKIKLKVYKGALPYSVNGEVPPADVYTTPYDSKYITAMRDTNYVKYEVGSRHIMSLFPEEFYDSGTINYYYYADVVSGYRYYNIGTSLNNNFGTLVCDDNVIEGEIYNSKWEEYQANNRNRWLSYGVNAGIKVVQTVATMAAGYGMAGAAFSGRQLAVNVAQASGQMRSSAALRQAIENRLHVQGSALDTTMSGGSSLLDELALKPIGMLMHERNLKLIPNTVERQGTNSTFGPMDNLNIYYQVSKVLDFEKCAWQYHLYGYLLMKPIDTYSFLSDIMEQYKVRYHFNYLSFHECDVHLNGALETQDIIAAIKDRLVSGIRYWDISHTSIGTYEYDNTEI